MLSTADPLVLGIKHQSKNEILDIRDVEPHVLPLRFYLRSFPGPMCPFSEFLIWLRITRAVLGKSQTF